MSQETITPAQLAAHHARRRGRRWSAATRTRCEQAHAHPSKMEARVCDRLYLEQRAAGLVGTIFRQVRLPLWVLGPDGHGRPHYLTVDFAIVDGRTPTRYLDAKARTRVSRDWRRGAAAFAMSYGPIEEVSA